MPGHEGPCKLRLQLRLTFIIRIMQDDALDIKKELLPFLKKRNDAANKTSLPVYHLILLYLPLPLWSLPFTHHW